MREIKFRGQSNSTGKWYFGYYIKSDNGPEGIDHVIQFTSGYRDDIDPDTVGQYTGLKDKHGKEIYEGDICFIQIYGNFGEPSDKESFNVQVKWEGNAFHLVDADGDTWTEWATYYKGEDVEIIGNIHENPELLEQPNAN